MPRVITYQRKRANRRIVNEEGFLRMLREFGEVRSSAATALGTLRSPRTAHSQTMPATSIQDWMLVGLKFP